jgi:PGF-CTERM protein
MIDSSSGLFTAEGVGTATVTVTATYNGVTKTDAAIVSVSGSTEQIPVAGDNFTEPPIDAGTAVINMSGWFDNDVTGNIDVTPEASTGSYAFTGDGQVLLGIDMSPDINVTGELGNGGDKIHLEICYDPAELERLNIDPATLVIWRYDGSTWVEMVNGTPPCIGNGRDGTCVWVELDNLSIFALVGTLKSQPGGTPGGGGGEGTYPPGWFETPTPTTTETPTAPAPTEAKLATTPDEDEIVTPAAECEAPAKETETAEMKTKGIPGFEAVFMIAGLLAVVYLVLRRRE